MRSKLLLIISFLSFTAMANYDFPADYPELHIFKNDGIPSHQKYTCVNRQKCLIMLQAMRYRYPNMSCATKIFIKDKGRVSRIK